MIEGGVLSEDNLNSKTYVEDVLEACYLNTAIFAKTFFPDIVSTPFVEMHLELFRLFDDPKVKKAAAAAPRGTGKTTLANIFCAKKTLYRDINFLTYMSKSSTSAQLSTDNLKMLLMSSPEVTKLFGAVKAQKGALDGYDQTFSKAAWATSYGAFVLPRGCGQQVRGLLYRFKRPDLFVFDDLEDDELLASEEQRKKIKDWFHSQPMKCIDEYSEDYKFIYIDTVKHEDSLLEQLLKSPEWESVRLSLCDENCNTNNPYYMSTERIKQVKKEHEARGALDIFYREYLGLPVSTEDAVFMPPFQRFKESEIGDKFRMMKSVVLVDPAKTVKLHSADSAIVGVSFDREHHGIYVRDIVSGKLYPDELYDEALKMVARLGAFKLAVEVTSLNEFITQPFKNQIRQRGIPTMFVELKARGKKEERIAALAPYYRQGWVWHNEACCGKLETQLMSFPRSQLWDVMDAFAYIVEMLEMDGDYFENSELLPEGDAESIYEELENEGSLEDWRFI